MSDRMLASKDRRELGSSGRRGGLPRFLCTTSWQLSYAGVRLSEFHLPGPTYFLATLHATSAWPCIVTSQVLFLAVDTSRRHVGLVLTSCLRRNLGSGISKISRARYGWRNWRGGICHGLRSGIRRCSVRTRLLLLRVGRRRVDGRRLPVECWLSGECSW